MLLNHNFINGSGFSGDIIIARYLDELRALTTSPTGQTAQAYIEQLDAEGIRLASAVATLRVGSSPDFIFDALYVPRSSFVVDPASGEPSTPEWQYATAIARHIAYVGLADFLE